MLSAGAFAAFLATSLGLLLALSSAVAHDLLPGAGLRRLRLAPLAGAVVIVALALPAVNIDVGVLVTSAFAVAAATFCPLLVLGIWWPRLTAAGAVAGVVVGLVASVGAIGVDLFLGAPEGLASSLLGQPALWTVPLAFAVMVGVSLRGRPPAWAAAATLRLHLDESNGLTVRRRRATVRRPLVARSGGVSRPHFRRASRRPSWLCPLDTRVRGGTRLEYDRPVTAAGGPRLGSRPVLPGVPGSAPPAAFASSSP